MAIALVKSCETGLNTNETAGDTFPKVFLEPSKEVPYIVVRDQVSLMVDVQTAMSNNTFIGVRMECAQVSLDQSTLNQLLRTQSV